MAVAFHLYEDTWETSTTTGTGAYTLAGAVGGWRAFSSQYANADTCWYSAYDGTNFEHGIGTYNSGGNTLSRTTIYRSSNAGAAVNWAAGTRNIVVAPLGAVLDSLLAPGSAGYPKRTADNSWTYVADPLPVANGGTNYTGGGWPTYTATLTPDVGLITNGGSSGDLQIGKFVAVTLAPTVSAISGSPTSVTVTLPVAPKRDIGVAGKEVVNTGDRIMVQWAAGSAVSLGIRNLVTGAVRAPALNDEYALSFSYEAQ